MSRSSKAESIRQRFPRMAMAFVLAFALSAVASAAEYKPGEVIIKFKDGVMRTHTSMNAFYDAFGVKSVKRFGGTMKGYEQLTLADNIKVEDAVADLSRNEMVEYAQPNYILHALPIQHLAPPPGGGLPCIPGMEIPGCDPNGGGGGGGGGVPGMPDGGGAMPCIPGMEIPGCDPNAKMPCLLPGVPFPPGCDDSGNPPSDPNQPPTQPPGQPPSQPPTSRPELQPAPAEVNPPVADPDLAKAYGLSKIGATEAWKVHAGNKNFIVADIDTGIDYNHEDLAFNVWRNPNPGAKKDIVGYDFVHDDGLPFDDNEHGTHTAGTIGAVGGNGKAISGVIQKVSIMSLKFLSGEGSGTTADAVKAIDYAIEHGAKVLSNSWGGPGDADNKVLYDAIERAKAKNVLFIAAAGNDGVNNDSGGQQISYPAAFDNDNLIAVAATDSNDKLAFFSNYGKKTTHVAAPGVNVYSTVPGNKYAALSGTSMACPHVAGAAALIWSQNPNMDYKQVKKVLMDSVDKLPSLADKTVTGGRINVLKALRTTME